MNYLERLGEWLFNWREHKDSHDFIMSMIVVLALLGWVMAW